MDRAGEVSAETGPTIRTTAHSPRISRLMSAPRSGVDHLFTTEPQRRARQIDEFGLVRQQLASGLAGLGVAACGPVGLLAFPPHLAHALLPLRPPPPPPHALPKLAPP